jgi:hypothetical protein
VRDLLLRDGSNHVGRRQEHLQKAERSAGPDARVHTPRLRREPLQGRGELLLLFLLGVSSNVIAFMVDKSIDLLGAARARAAQDGTTFLR